MDRKEFYVALNDAQSKAHRRWCALNDVSRNLINQRDFFIPLMRGKKRRKKLRERTEAAIKQIDAERDFYYDISHYLRNHVKHHTDDFGSIQGDSTWDRRKRFLLSVE